MSGFNTDTAVQRAIRAAGGSTAVAAKFGVSRVSVHEWLQNGRVPADKAPIVADLAAKAGVYIQLEELCPPFPWGVAKAHMDGGPDVAEPAAASITAQAEEEGG